MTTLAVVDALNAIGCDFALLDGSESALLDPSSDIDIVAATPLPGILGALAPELGRSGVHPVMAVHYDVGRGDSVWLVGPRDDFLQLDVLSDPTGINRLAMATEEMLQSAKPGSDGVRRVPRESEVAYRVAKNLHRQRYDTLRELDRGELDPSRLKQAIEGVYPGLFSAVATAMTDGDWRSARASLERARRLARLRRGGWRLWALMAQRWARRTVDPVGFWIHFTGPAAAHAVDLAWDRWGRGVAVRFKTQLSPLRPITRLRIAVAIRRPCIAVTWGRLTPDGALVVDVGEECPPWNELRLEILERASARLVERFR
jgi:hypothetical protein